MIDLHVHSRYSDGTDTPEALVRRAKGREIVALALTDHDTTDGIDEFKDACRKHEIIAIGGVEISAASNDGSLHIIGLGIDHEDPGIIDFLATVRDSRRRRNQRIIAKLNELDIPITWDSVVKAAGDEMVGRPHFAKALQEMGYAESVAHAFEIYLGQGKAAYAERFKPSPADAIGAVKRSGGVAVLAHPFLWIKQISRLRPAVGRLIKAGLDGIEAHHTTHQDHETEQLIELAIEHDLIITGGSDYHGLDIKPDHEIGVGRGNLAIPTELLDPLFKSIGDG